MTQFNIHNSKIEQANDSGNNYKMTSKSGNNTVSQNGNVVQTDGTQNKVQVDKPGESSLSMLWAKIKMGWKWLVG